jgi:hypothetical protein
MPTRRALIFFVLALMLYLLANQTQVGWVYIMVDILLGLLLAAFFYSRGMLKPIQIRRAFHNVTPQPSPLTPQQRQSEDENDDPALTLPVFFEDDPIEVRLWVEQASIKPAFLIGGREQCPFAPPGERSQPLFIPSLFRSQPVELVYQTQCDRRGVYTFGKLQLHSKGLFGFLNTKRILTAPGEILIYPKYHGLKRIRLLESRGFADRQVICPGGSHEIIGVREYRSGDPLRQIHWRSTARVGKFVVKEISDNDQLTMTVVLDLSVEGNVGQGKYSTFETAIRIAASLAYYATHENIPFFVVGQSQYWKPPATALSWWGALNYLAKVENDGQTALAHVLRNLPLLPFVVVLVSKPDEAISQALVWLQQKGVQTLAIFITPDGTFPTSGLLPAGNGPLIKTVSPHNWTAVLDEL